MSKLHSAIAEEQGGPALTNTGPVLPTPEEAKERLARMNQSAEAYQILQDPMHPRHAEMKAERTMLVKASMGDRAFDSAESGVRMG